MTKRPRPSKRLNTTYAFKVGNVGMHMTLSRYEDSTPMEVFLDVAHAEGSTIRALMGALARLISTGLQHGTPVDSILDQLIGTKFEPAGIGHGHISIEDQPCTSLLDACGRILQHELRAHYSGFLQKS